MPLVKLSLFILFASFSYQFFASFFDGSLSKVIALPTIATAIVVALIGDSEKITVTFRQRLGILEKLPFLKGNINYFAFLW